MRQDDRSVRFDMHWSSVRRSSSIHRLITAFAHIQFHIVLIVSSFPICAMYFIWLIDVVSFWIDEWRHFVHVGRWQIAHELILKTPVKWTVTTRNQRVTFSRIFRVGWHSGDNYWNGIWFSNRWLRWRHLNYRVNHYTQKTAHEILLLFVLLWVGGDCCINFYTLITGLNKWLTRCCFIPESQLILRRWIYAWRWVEEIE